MAEREEGARKKGEIIEETTAAGKIRWAVLSFF